MVYLAHDWSSSASDGLEFLLAASRDASLWMSCSTSSTPVAELLFASAGWQLPRDKKICKYLWKPFSRMDRHKPDADSERRENNLAKSSKRKMSCCSMATWTTFRNRSSAAAEPRKSRRRCFLRRLFHRPIRC